MAELILNIGNSPDPTRYQDGDIICAFNRHRIRVHNAEIICRPRLGNGKREVLPNGLWPNNPLTRHFFNTIFQYRFERLNNRTAKRINLATNDEEIVTDNWDLFIARRIATNLDPNRTNGGKPLFGELGHEVWYGGNIDTSDSKFDLIWQKIEELTPKREADHQLWPLSETEKRHFLALPVDDFDDDTQTAYESSETDDEGRIIQRRLHKVDFRSLVTARKLQDIEDKTIEVDLRVEIQPLTRTSVISQKERTR